MSGVDRKKPRQPRGVLIRRRQASRRRPVSQPGAGLGFERCIERSSAKQGSVGGPMDADWKCGVGFRHAGLTRVDLQKENGSTAAPVFISGSRLSVAEQPQPGIILFWRSLI